MCANCGRGIRCRRGLGTWHRDGTYWCFGDMALNELEHAAVSLGYVDSEETGF